MGAWSSRAEGCKGPCNGGRAGVRVHGSGVREAFSVVSDLGEDACSAQHGQARKAGDDVGIRVRQECFLRRHRKLDDAGAGGVDLPDERHFVVPQGLGVQGGAEPDPVPRCAVTPSAGVSHAGTRPSRSLTTSFVHPRVARRLIHDQGQCSDRCYTTRRDTIRRRGLRRLSPSCPPAWCGFQAFAEHVDFLGRGHAEGSSVTESARRRCSERADRPPRARLGPISVAARRRPQPTPTPQPGLSVGLLPHRRKTLFRGFDRCNTEHPVQ